MAKLEAEKLEKARKLARRVSLTLKRQGGRDSDHLGAAMSEEQEKLLKLMGKKREALLAFFSSWDTNGDGYISRLELHKSLPLTGVPAEKATVDALFDTMDYARLGRVAIDHLSSCLRWASVKAGGIKADHPMTIKVKFDAALPLAEQLRDALSQNAARVIDLFREFDEDGDGEISSAELHKALPLLGIPLSREQTQEAFDSWDVRTRAEPRAARAPWAAGEGTRCRPPRTWRHARVPILRRCQPHLRAHAVHLRGPALRRTVCVCVCARRPTAAARSASASSTSCCGATAGTRARRRRRGRRR